MPTLRTLTASPTTLSFAGVTSERTVTIRNSGDDPVAIPKIVVSSGYSESHTCAASLAVGQECTITVAAAAKANAGALKISTSSGRPLTVALAPSTDRD